MPTRIKYFAAVIVLMAALPLTAEAKSGAVAKWAEGWRYAFSKEGVKEWKPELRGAFMVVLLL